MFVAGVLVVVAVGAGWMAFAAVPAEAPTPVEPAVYHCPVDELPDMLQA